MCILTLLQISTQLEYLDFSDAQRQATKDAGTISGPALTKRVVNRSLSFATSVEVSLMSLSFP